MHAKLDTSFDLSCFPSSYRMAREKLLLRVAKLSPSLLRDQQAIQHPLRGPAYEPLYLDWLQLGQSDTPEQVLVLICATHGVEGFAGSAVFSHCLPELGRQLQQNPQLGVILIHGLNPWGFAWQRRYDHENIDLNRNFIDFGAQLPENSGYQQLHQELFQHNGTSLGDTLERWRSQWDKSELEATITRGQYQYANGLFYGGNHASWSRLTLQQASACPFLQQATQIAVIDFHTGLGPFGHGEVINDHEPGSAGFDLACQWYGANAQAALLGESCSTPKTGLLDYFWHQLMAERGCFVTLEFGTYSPQQLLSALREEQYYHNSYADQLPARDLSHPAVVALRDFFYPQDQSWRQLVLFRATQIIGLALAGLRQ